MYTFSVYKTGTSFGIPHTYSWDLVSPLLQRRNILRTVYMYDTVLG